MVQVAEEVRRRAGTAGAGPGRVPPHDLSAEESLLGAMLLHRDAIAAATEVCTADAFYKPAHGHIYDAMCSLYAKGEPVDPVTVADELRRFDLLDAVGGPSVIVALQASTPATGNAARYARIVEELALLRRLIGVAGEIAELGYEVPDDVDAAVDRAESLVFEVAQRRVADTMAPLRDLLGQTLDRLEALFDRGEEITGIPTGFLDLDHQLAGLQPSNLIIVGARPGCGKALSLDTPIATPSGWTTMGNLAVGDEVFDDQGQACRVTYATPVMLDRQCYRVEFDDGSTIVADADHQWFAYDLPAWKSVRSLHDRLAGPARDARFSRDQSERRRLPRVVTTQQMLDEGVHVDGDGRPNWYLPLAKPLDLLDADLPVDPYVLGCWLGDGASQGSAPTIGDEDWRHFHGELVAAGYAFERRGDALQWATVPVRGQGAWQGYNGPLRVLTRELQSVGLLGGTTKHVPAPYLRASTKQRLALLQGLMDTGGSALKTGAVEIGLSSRSLLLQAHELVCSLGHRPGPVRERAIRLPDGRTVAAWRFGWTPPDDVFRLPRKASRLGLHPVRQHGRTMRRVITAIRPVPSVPVRCITVDSPAHLYLAGRTLIPTHNTSFALNVAAHAAIHARRPVLFFSLEMSQIEISSRLLCAEARVDSSRMRNGRLLESDWPKISQAIGKLGEAPIFVDDNPMVTVMDIRGKSRRLKSKLGDLGLVVVDYIQLMTGRSKAENRQVEVSEISRGLKILARELECPVIALSQLSRNLESRADKRPVLADLRESGCLTAASRVLRADTGGEVTLGELFRQGARDIPVWSVDDASRMVPATMTHVFSSGVKPTFRLRLASGRTLEATANHPFLTGLGWTALGDLGPGSRVAVPPVLAEPERPAPTAAAVATLARLDVLWDVVVGVDPLGEEQVFDATVPGTHNFVANGIVVHNSLEQDADVVLFLYRDELYDHDSQDRGIAEVHVSKHRSGPTGVTKLAFLDQFTRFANMAKV